MKPSIYFYHMKTKTLADFQIYISVPLVFVFQEFFTSTKKISILAKRLGTRLSFHEVLRLS